MLRCEGYETRRYEMNFTLKASDLRRHDAERVTRVTGTRQFQLLCIELSI